MRPKLELLDGALVTRILEEEFQLVDYIEAMVQTPEVVELRRSAGAKNGDGRAHIPVGLPQKAIASVPQDGFEEQSLKASFWAAAEAQVGAVEFKAGKTRAADKMLFDACMLACDLRLPEDHKYWNEALALERALGARKGAYQRACADPMQLAHQNPLRQ